MNLHLTGITRLAVLLLAGCGRMEPAVAPANTKPAAIIAAAAPESTRVEAERRVTRTIDQDPDGDGIANRRIVITETYDVAGVLVERIREVDFEADGIIDARSSTTSR